MFIYTEGTSEQKKKQKKKQKTTGLDMKCKN